VWQVAVDAAARGHGVAASMLDHLADRVGCTHLETTITADNAASIALFSAFAQRHGAAVERTELFAAAELGAGIKPEFLHRIGPITTTTGEMHTG
jgi:L-2,4-diaminobutyric acid acetyltransferase